MVDHRKFLRDRDPDPTPQQRAEFNAIVAQEVRTLRRSTREQVGNAIERLLRNPRTKNRVGPQLIEKLPGEIERRLEN